MFMMLARTLPHLPRARAAALHTHVPRTATRFAQKSIACRTTTRRSISSSSKSTSPPAGVKTPSAIAQRLPDPREVEAPRRFREFELDGRVFVVTGGARGLGLALAEVLVEAGGHVYCLDRAPAPHQSFYETQQHLAHHFEGSLHYRQVDVTHDAELNRVIAAIADQHQRFDGCVANAGIQHAQPALEYDADEVPRMYNVNCGGVFLTARACARQMIRYQCPGSVVLVGSMSGLNANKGFHSVIYNSSKAGVIQMARNLAMEWGQIINGHPIRVNTLCPGNILTPMVAADFARDPTLRPQWEAANFLGRISETREYRGAVLFMLSDAASFMTGACVVIDGGYTAW